jgi:hypothetical protein
MRPRAAGRKELPYFTVAPVTLHIFYGRIREASQGIVDRPDINRSGNVGRNDRCWLPTNPGSPALEVVVEHHHASVQMECDHKPLPGFRRARSCPTGRVVTKFWVVQPKCLQPRMPSA